MVGELRGTEFSRAYERGGGEAKLNMRMGLGGFLGQFGQIFF